MAAILVIMGPPGTGKTTLGQALAARLGWPFADGDDLHPAANIAKLTSGTPLNDEDRAPWLAAIGALMDTWATAGSGGVVTCSALKKRYRDGLRAGRAQMRLIYLEGDPETLRARVSARAGHFMPPELLADQLRVLEPPGVDEAPIVIEAEMQTAAQVETAIAALRLDQP
jgi:gluconokinase